MSRLLPVGLRELLACSITLCLPTVSALAALPTPAEVPASPGLLLVANKADRTLGIIDPAVGKQITAVPEEGITGHEVAASPDGQRAFVPIYGNSGVGGQGTDGRLLRVIDLGKREIIGTVDFGKGVRPHCAVFGPKDGLLYVTTEIDNSVSVVDPRALKIIAAIPTGAAESHMLAISRDGRRGYTANVGPGSVSVLDLQERELVKVIPVADRIQRVSLSTDDRYVFTADQLKSELAVIDASMNTVARRVPLPSTAYGTAATPDGHWLLLALNRKSKLAFLNLQSMHVEHLIDVPKAPQEILIGPEGIEAYVSCDASAQVAVVDLKNFQVAKLIHAGHGADGLAWAAQ